MVTRAQSVAASVTGAQGHTWAFALAALSIIAVTVLACLNKSIPDVLSGIALSTTVGGAALSLPTRGGNGG